jgi:hypothetical protein
VIRLLISFHYYPKLDLAEKIDEAFGDREVPVFADSGAYSAWTKGAPIDVNDYATWLLRSARRFESYANLDVIGDDDRAAAATAANQATLEGLGLKPLPVFHAGESWTALEALLDAGYTYIGLGGLVGRGPKAVMPWLVKAFRMAEGRAVFHGFGVTNLTISRSLPFYSLDSTTWKNYRQYGEIQLWDDTRRQFVKIMLANTTLRERHALIYKHAALLRKHDVDPAVVTNPRFGRPDEGKETAQTGRESDFLASVNMKAWENYEAFLQRHHRVEFPGDPSKVGPLIYLSDNGITQLSRVLRVREEQEALA